MRDILSTIEQWISIDAEQPFALVTVLQTWGSAPRGAGSVMAVRFDTSGELLIAGSVSGGCIENVVIEESEIVLTTGTPTTMTFSVADETAWSVGLSCGGTVKVLIEPHIAFHLHEQEQAVWQAYRQALANKTPCTMVTRLSAEQFGHCVVFDDGRRVGTLNAAKQEFMEAVQATALAMLAERRSAEVTVLGEQMFVHTFPLPPKLVIVGAAHIAVHLVRLAQELGFEVVVIDPRGVFANPERFAGAQPDVLLEQWANEAFSTLALDEATCQNTFIVTLTHDPKIDDDALTIALNKPVRYIGALGSRKTHEKRCARLREAGCTAEQVSRIHAPIGLNIHAETPAEIALSIMAEIVQTMRS